MGVKNNYMFVIFDLPFHYTAVVG